MISHYQYEVIECRLRKWCSLAALPCGYEPVLEPHCCCSVTKSCPTFCNSMDYSKPGFPVLHYLLEFAQTHVHWIGDAIQPFHPLSDSSPPALSISQHQGFFQWVSSLHQVAKVLELQLQHQSFQWIFKIDFLYYWLVFAPCSPSDSQESSPILQFENHQFFGAQSSFWSNTNICIWLLKIPQLWLDRVLSENWCLSFLVCCICLS